ncbi:hypothetical protein CF319_g4416 [Tilletia indica]|nr:hypothetical protein CF319_g4416 [Tilletia indica]
MSTFVYSNLTQTNIHAVLAFTYADWWATQAEAAGFQVPDIPKVSAHYQNVFWYLNPPEAYALQVGLIYATVWLGAIGWDILSTLSFDLRLIRQTRWRSFPSTVHSLGYLCSRYSTLIWLIITIASLVVPSLDCQPKTRASGVAFALSIASMHLIFMMRTISIWNLNHRVIAPLLLLWLTILAGSLVLGLVAETVHIPGSYFCTGQNNKGFQVAEVFVVTALVLFDLLCLALTVAKLNKLGWRGIINGFIPRHRSHYDAEDWAAMLVHRTTLFCIVQFLLLFLFVILQVIPSLAPYRSMQVIATTTIGSSMAGRIFRQSWRLTREHSPANVNRPPSYYPGWAEDHSHLAPGQAQGRSGAESARGTGGGAAREGITPVPMVAKMPMVRKSPMSAGVEDYDPNDSYVEGEFKFVKPFLMGGGGGGGAAAALGSLGASLTGSAAGGVGVEAAEDVPNAAIGGTGSHHSGGHTAEVGWTPAERYAAEHSGRGRSRSRNRHRRDRSVERGEKSGFGGSRSGVEEGISIREGRSLPRTPDGREIRVQEGIDEIRLLEDDHHAGGPMSSSHEMTEVRSFHTIASTTAERVLFGNYSLASGALAGSRWSILPPTSGGVGSSNAGSSSQPYGSYPPQTHNHYPSTHQIRPTSSHDANGGVGSGPNNAGVGGSAGAESASLLRIDLGRRRTFPTLWAEAAKNDHNQQHVKTPSSASSFSFTSGVPVPPLPSSKVHENEEVGGGGAIGEMDEIEMGSISGGGGIPASFVQGSMMYGSTTRSFDPSTLSRPSTAATASASRPSTGTQPQGTALLPFGGSETTHRLSTPNRHQHGLFWEQQQQLPNATASARQIEKRRSFFLASPPLSAGPIPSGRSRMVYDFKALKEASEMRHVDGCCGTEVAKEEEGEEDGDGGKGTVVEKGRGRKPARPKTAPTAATRTMRRVASSSSPSTSTPQPYQVVPPSASSAASGQQETLPTLISSGQSAASESPSSATSAQAARLPEQPPKSQEEEEEEELDAQSAFRQVVDQDADARRSIMTSSVRSLLPGDEMPDRSQRQSMEMTEDIRVESPSPSRFAFPSTSSSESVFAFSIDMNSNEGVSTSTSAAAMAAAEALDARRPGTANTSASVVSGAAMGDDGRPRTSRGGPVHAFGSTELPGSAGAIALSESSSAAAERAGSRERAGSLLGSNGRRVGVGAGRRPGSSGGWAGNRPGTAGRG